jgi:hypothetical protein
LDGSYSEGEGGAPRMGIVVMDDEGRGHTKKESEEIEEVR